MSRRIYITFSGQRYNEQTRLIVDRAPRMGADEVWVYDDLWLTRQEFYRLPQNRWLWEHHGDQHNNKRGFGWFCWKPYVILHALDRCEPGDIVLYTDADTYPIHDFSVLYEECARAGGQMMFAAQGRNNKWDCKLDCFAVMGQNEPKYRDSQAGVARFMLFQKGPWQPRQFLYEWLAYCLNPLAQTFDASVLGPEHPEYREHRTEQAIMTLLCLKYGLKFYREACEFGNGSSDDRDLYPQLFEQVYGHGSREVGNGSLYRNIP